jgi:hypothetical protein
MHELQAKAIWANGLTYEDIKADRILEMKKGQVFCYLCGYVAVIVNTMTNPPSIECWNPEIEGTGFIFTQFSDFGYPTEIEIKMKFSETGEPYKYFVPNFPVETMKVKAGTNEAGEPIMKDYHIRERPDKKGYGFFIVRTSKGLPGVRGLPQFLPLMHPVRNQTDILNAYIPYAKKQGMGFPFIGLKDNTPQRRADIKTAWSSQPQTNRLVIDDSETVVDYIQPLAGAYDPFPILQWIDMLIARKTQMNKLMLEGDPSGNLSSSETAENNWVTDIKEQQVFWKAQWKPIWMVLGAPEECSFQDPSKPAFISLWEGISKMVEALMPIVEIEDIVKLANEYIEKRGEDFQLTPLDREKMMMEEGQKWESKQQEMVAGQARRKEIKGEQKS